MNIKGIESLILYNEKLIKFHFKGDEMVEHLRSVLHSLEVRAWE